MKLDHPCKETCSGYKAGYDKGYDFNKIYYDKTKILEGTIVNLEALLKQQKELVDELNKKINELEIVALEYATN